MLERWNIGKMDPVILVSCVNGDIRLMKNNNGITSFKETHYSIIPLFHNSIIEAKKRKAIKIPHIFIEL
jgi:hypothetical protein